MKKSNLFLCLILILVGCSNNDNISITSNASSINTSKLKDILSWSSNINKDNISTITIESGGEGVSPNSEAFLDLYYSSNKNTISNTLKLLDNSVEQCEDPILDGGIFNQYSFITKEKTYSFRTCNNYIYLNYDGIKNNCYKCNITFNKNDFNKTLKFACYDTEEIDNKEFNFDNIYFVKIENMDANYTKEVKLDYDTLYIVNESIFYIDTIESAGNETSCYLNRSFYQIVSEENFKSLL